MRLPLPMDDAGDAAVCGWQEEVSCAPSAVHHNTSGAVKERHAHARTSASCYLDGKDAKEEHLDGRTRGIPCEFMWNSVREVGQC